MSLIAPDTPPPHPALTPPPPTSALCLGMPMSIMAMSSAWLARFLRSGSGASEAANCGQSEAGV
jgi:Sec-independent protein secretion pathway component TatC